MKKILVILVLAFLAGKSYPQSEVNDSRIQIRNYFEQNVNPFLMDQQNIYMSALSDDDREAVISLRDNNNKPVRGEQSYNRAPGKRGKGSKGRGGKNNPKFDNKNNNKSKITEDLLAITDNYPDQNKEYSKAVQSRIIIWKNDLSEMHDELGVDFHMGKGGQPGYESFFQNISTPEGLLLWQPRQIDEKNSKVRYSKNKKDINPEVKAEINEYAQAEILPVIVQERDNFNKYLSDDEKKIISDTRAKIQVRKAMFKSWYESEDFVPGERAKDPNFDGMREDMRSSMQKVRGISLLHNDEIKEAMDEIHSNNDKWEGDISKIALSFDNKPESVIVAFHEKMRKDLTPVNFLLLNTEDPELFADKVEMRVFIYPNPFSEKATIAIIGANGDNINIELKNKDGKTTKELFSGKIDEDRFELTVLADDIEGGSDLLKISSEDVVIKRRLSLIN